MKAHTPTTTNSSVSITVQEDENDTRGGNTWLPSLLSILFYSFCSVCMIVLNKVVMFTFKSDITFTVILLQNLAGLAVLVIGKAMGVVDYASFDWHVAKRWLPLAFLFIIMLASSLLSFAKISIPLFSAIKTLSAVCTSIGEAYLFGVELTQSTLLSCFIIVIGALCAAVENVMITPLGLLYCLVNVISTTVYLLYLKYLLQDKSMADLGSSGSALYSQLTSLPILAVLVVASQEHNMVADSELLSSTMGVAVFCLLLLIGALMPISTNYCMKKNTATTYSIVGTVNKVPTTLLGVILFNQYPTMMGWLGVMLSIAGGFYYSWGKLKK